MSTTSISVSMTKFITDHFSHAGSKALRDDDPLLEGGIVDSLGVLDIVSFIESEFGVTVADEDLVKENFGSIARITAYVESRQR